MKNQMWLWIKYGLSFIVKHSYVVPIVILFLLYLSSAFYELKDLKNGIKIFLIVSIIITALMPQVFKFKEDYIDTDKIYLSVFNLFGDQEEISINGKGNKEIIFEGELKKGETKRIRFHLNQENKKTPRIGLIFINFPENVEVKIPDGENSLWLKTGYVENQYVYNCSPPSLFLKDVRWNLQHLNVLFTKIDDLKFSYSIVGENMDTITRKFIIKPRKNDNLDMRSDK
ncbi:MAG: hypothetical protein ABH869_03780 [Candidatus Omnitrophota bacterium]